MSKPARRSPIAPAPAAEPQVLKSQVPKSRAGSVVPITRPSRKAGPPAIAKSAEHLTRESIDRVDSVLYRLETRVAGLSVLIARLQRKKAIASGRALSIERRIVDRMDRAGVKTADGWHKTLELRVGPDCVTVDDETLIPKEYRRERIVSAPDKELIQKTLAQGFVISDIGQLPEFFFTGDVPNRIAIKAALEGSGTIPGVLPIDKIDGCRITHNVRLVRK